MKYDFDREVSREATNSMKWEFIQWGEEPSTRERTDECFGENRILPMWVADMDFPTPPAVIEALVERAKHGIFGYSSPSDSFYDAVVNWMWKRNGWKIQPEWICTTPGVVPAVNMMIRSFVQPGEGVLIQPPVYHPFYSVIENNGCEVVCNPLLFENGRYSMDFDDLDKKTQDPKVKMAILCHPHNPVGRVWTKEELQQFGEICIKNEVLIVSDEIHGDLIFKGITFTPFASISDEFTQKSITCTAPSKTFNLAGLKTSAIVIADEQIRCQYQETLNHGSMAGTNSFGIVALEAAYNHGEPWLEQLMEYIEGNYDYLEAYIADCIPEIEVIRPEGTYLIWLDCRKLGLDKLALKELMLGSARVYLDEGYIFGPEGEGFERINIACPRSILAEALERIRDTLHGSAENK